MFDIDKVSKEILDCPVSYLDKLQRKVCAIFKEQKRLYEQQNKECKQAGAVECIRCRTLFYQEYNPFFPPIYRIPVLLQLFPFAPFLDRNFPGQQPLPDDIQTLYYNKNVEHLTDLQMLVVVFDRDLHKAYAPKFARHIESKLTTLYQLLENKEDVENVCSTHNGGIKCPQSGRGTMTGMTYCCMLDCCNASLSSRTGCIEVVGHSATDTKCDVCKGWKSAHKTHNRKYHPGRWNNLYYCEKGEMTNTWSCCKSEDFRLQGCMLCPEVYS